MNVVAANDRMIAHLGLGILPTDRQAALDTTVRAILGVTIFIVLLDTVIFRRHLDVGYIAFYTSPLAGRTIPMCLKSLTEEFSYRLLIMTAIVAIIRIVRGKVSPQSFIVSAIIAQFYGVWPYVVHDPLYASLRYLAVGTAWGLLYWKRGWLAAASGHGLTHLVLDPLLLLGLIHTA